MNGHEARRIAAATHRLRPDWPEAQVLTLMRDHLADRPRRDVAVALVWVACEQDSTTPYRVLENGPWWKAIGGWQDDQRAPRPPRPADACRHCGRAMHHPDRICDTPTTHPARPAGNTTEQVARLRKALGEED